MEDMIYVCLFLFASLPCCLKSQIYFTLEQLEVYKILRLSKFTKQIWGPSRPLPSLPVQQLFYFLGSLLREPLWSL